MLRERAKAQLKELNERLQGGEHYENVLDDIYDTDDEHYADFNCETFSGTYLIKENRIGAGISVWDINEQGEIVGYLKNEIEEPKTIYLDNNGNIVIH